MAFDDIDAALSELRVTSPAQPKPKQVYENDEVDSALRTLRGEEPVDATSLTPVPIPLRKPNKEQVDLDQLSINLRKAAEANPTQAARDDALSRALNVPIELLPKDADVQAYFSASNPQALLRDFPEIANYLNQGQNAALNGRNIENLKAIRTSLKRVTVDRVVDAAKGTVAVPEFLVGVADLLSKGKAGKAVQDAGINFKDFKGRLDTLYTDEQKEANRKTAQAEGFLDTIGTALENPSTIASAITESIPSMLAGGAVGQVIKRFFPGVSALVAGAAGEGTVIAGSQAEKVRQQTETGELTGEQALLAAGAGVAGGAVGVLSAKLMQRMGFGDIDTALAGGQLQKALDTSQVPKGMASRILAGGVSEGVLEEMPQSAIEQITENIALGKKWDENVGNAAAMGLLTGTPLGATFGAVSGAAQPTGAAGQLDKLASGAVREFAKAAQAEESVTKIEALMKASAENPLRKDSPESFKEFVRTMADEDDSINDVYVDGETLQNVLNQSDIDLSKQIPGLARDIQVARETKGDVRISIEDFATHFAGTKAGEQLLASVKTDPEGMTFSEAQGFQQSQIKEFEKQAQEIVDTHNPVLSRAEFDAQNPGGDYATYLKEHTNTVEAFTADAQQVHDQILAGMNQAGRFNKAVNRLYAIPFREFYAVNAAREGIMPSELFKRLPLNFSKMSLDRGLVSPGRDALAQKELDDSRSDYQMEHRPPTRDNGAPINDLANSDYGIYPEDIYSSNAAQYYGHVGGRDKLDLGTAAIIRKFKGKPDAQITIYRAIPKSAKAEILPGDWTTINKDYAKQHGETWLDGSYKIISKKVSAKDIYTNGDSFHEWGYDPTIEGQEFAQRGLQPGSMTVMGVHFSKERRESLQGKFVGTGMPAAERDRLFMATDPRIKNRIDFYTDTGSGVKPESGLGSVRHDVLLNNIYDGSTNPLGFKVPYKPGNTGMNDFESQVIDAGFDGYFIKQGNQGRVVVLGDAANNIPTGNKGTVPPVATNRPGGGTAAFFTKMTLGLDGKPGVEYTPVLPLGPAQLPFLNEYAKHRGNFDSHIRASIPGFGEVQVYTGAAIVAAYPDGAHVLDIGASEGSWAKTITALSDSKIKTDSLEPLEAMVNSFNEISTVEGARVLPEAFGDTGWTEEATGFVVKPFKPEVKYDVIHESMVFQFIDDDRKGQIARVKSMIADDGIYLTEEKFANDGSAQYKEREALKDQYKSKYFTSAAIADKSKEVLAVGMNNLMVKQDELEAELKNNFKYVVQYWSSTNFGGYVASDSSEAVKKFLSNLPSTESQYSNAPPHRVVKGRIKLPEAKKVEGATSFEGWFSGSKVVNADGSPKIVYHGTKKNFDAFEVGAEGMNSGTFGSWPTKRAGIFFSEDPSEANEFAVQGVDRTGANVMPVFLSIKNPLDLRNGFEYDPSQYDALAKAGISERAMVNTYPENIWELFDEENGGSDFVDMVKKAGYDGVLTAERNPDTGKMFDVWIAFDPTQIKSATGNVGTFSSTNPNILNQSAFYSALEREIPGLQKIGDKQGMIQPHQAMKWVESRQREGKFKKEEVEAIGLIDWLEVQEGKIAVADIENFVRENGVQVEETVLDDQAQPSDDEVFDRAYEEFLSDNDFEGDEDAEQEAWNDQSDFYLTSAREELGRNVPGIPEYISYTLPGGENYKELLLTLPGKRLFRAPHFENVDETIIAHTRIDERVIEVPLTDEQQAALDKYEKDYAAINEEAKPALARRRVAADAYEAELKRIVKETGLPVTEVLDNMPQSLKDAAAESEAALAAVKDFSARVPVRPQFTKTKQRVLFVEEIQSDWAQQGRDEGFTTQEKEGIEELIRLEAESKTLFKEMKAAVDDDAAFEPLNNRFKIIRGRIEELKKKSYNIPPGPFVKDTKSWTALVVKRLMRYAAENGFDRIAWATGAQQNARYDLSKKVSEIQYDPERKILKVRDVNDNKIMDQVVEPEDIENHIGEGLAKKLLESPINGTYHQLTGVKDLEIGGEGMKSFYDRIVPSVFNDVSKKLGGGKVEVTDLNKPIETWETFHSRQPGEPREAYDRMVARIQKERIESPRDDAVGMQQSIAIPPEMRDKIMQGLPLFQGQRAGFNPESLTISLLQGSDLSSVIHEGGHFYLEALRDMASQPNAPQQIKDDFRKTLNWFGVANETQWDSMTLDQKRPYHEQWAQSFERYTLEGKAPTVEMQPVFQRFRAWMLNIYKSLQEFLRQNPLAGKLNDDIRGVFDRLIANENEIARTEKLRSYAPLFADAESAGLTEKQYDDYLALGKQATQDAADKLNSRSIRDMKWLSGARSRALRSLQAEAKAKRKLIRAEVTQEIAQEPVERAKLFLSKGQYIDDQGQVIEAIVKAKLNLAEVKKLKPSFNPNDLRGMTAEDGLGLDVAGQMFGYTSGEALLDDLLTTDPTREKIQGRTDQRMLEEHGDLVDDRALENAADEAVHNEARARFMATGLSILTGKKTRDEGRQLTKAAKQAAESVIAAKLIREIQPGQYAAAETRANKEALKQAPKDKAKAAEAQRAALLNNKLYATARDARTEVDQILRYVKKFDNNRKPNRPIDFEYIEQINDLLRPFNFKNISLKEIDKSKTLAEWVNEQEANGFQPALNVDTLERVKNTKKSYKDMTLDELRGLRDAVKQIEHIGRLKHKLLTARDKAAFQERIDEADQSIRDNANRTVEERGTPTDITGRTGQWFRQAAASFRKFSSIVREMDGGKNNGVMWNLLSRGMNDAGNQETEMRQQAAQKMAELFKMIKLEQGFANLYAKKRVVPGTNLSMTHEQRIMFGMNWGNEGNRQRLLDGGMSGQRAISRPEAQAILDTLTQPEWDFIQATLDYIGTYKDQIAALEKQLTGVEPIWIEPSEIKTKFGNYKGGYFPAKYDAELSSRSEAFEAMTDLRMGMKGIFNAAATRHGYTQERSKQVIGRPILLSFDVIPTHVNEVIHRLSWQPWLTDANRILKALDLPIREHYGPEILRELRNTVTDIAAGDASAKNAWEASINHLRVGSTIIGMGWKVSTALLQPTGLAQTYVRIGPKWATKGVLQFLGSPLKSAELVDSKSSMMRNRGITMQREVNEVLNTLRAGETASNVKASYFLLIGKMQRMVDIPTWIGAYEGALESLKYENALDEGQRKGIEEQAAALADQAVIDSQSGGMTKDLAAIQRGSPLQKLFTNFFSYFSATYNLNVEAVRKTNFYKPSEVGILGVNLIMLNIVPVIFSLALKEATKGECGDDLECLTGKLIQEQISFLFGQMVGLRELSVGATELAKLSGVEGIESYGYQGPAGLRFFTDFAKAGKQIAQGELDLPLFKSVNNTLGAVFHYPAGQINNTVAGIIAVEEGQVEGVSILPALVFGPPKE